MNQPQVPAAIRSLHSVNGDSTHDYTLKTDITPQPKSKFRQGYGRKLHLVRP